MVLLPNKQQISWLHYSLAHSTKTTRFHKPPKAPLYLNTWLSFPSSSLELEFSLSVIPTSSYPMSIPIVDTDELQAKLNLAEEPDFVATGGFKAVFRSGALSDQEEAIKAVHLPRVSSDEELLAREQLVARAKREIVALSECNHSGIVKLGSLEPIELTIGGEDFLVYSEEFLPGTALDAWVKTRKDTSYEELFGIMWALVDLIGELSNLGYLHRDIKPGNVMETTYTGRQFVVLDMGIAYKEQGTDLSVGGPPGTLRYMAPELLRPDYKDLMDFRSDIYSAALTVYVLASKFHPFAPKPEGDHHTMYRIVTCTPDPLHSLRPDLPQKFCRIIDRCIRKKAALRFGSISSLKEALSTI